MALVEIGEHCVKNHIDREEGKKELHFSFGEREFQNFEKIGEGGDARCNGGKDCEYERKRPFVLFDFANPDGCLAVLSGRYEFVEAATRGCVAIVGAGDSYAVQFNNLMTKLQNMLIPSKFVDEIE